MPAFKTVEQARQWCAVAFPSTPPTPTHWSLPDMHINWFMDGIYLVLIAGAWVVGRYGIPAVWSDIKSIYSWIRSIGKKTQPTATLVA